MSKQSVKSFPVVIPKKQVTQKKNAQGNMYWLVAIPNTTKELYIPHEWLKLSADGKTYKGSFETERDLMGRIRNSITVKGEELQGVFPTKDGKEV